MSIKRIRFPLEMENETEVRTIEELRENFSMEKVLMYFSDGKLIKWLHNNYLDEEAEAISALDPKDNELNRKICDILGVEYNDSHNVNLGEVAEAKQRLTRLKEYTSEKRYIDVIDKVAFDQMELNKLIGAGETEVYLCGEKFVIPFSRKNMKYIGINNPIAVIPASYEIDFKAKNIKFENVRFNEEYLKAVAEEKLNADFSGSAGEWVEPQLKMCKKCIELNENNAKRIMKEYSAKGYIHYSILLKDFQYDFYHGQKEYKGTKFRNGSEYRIRNLISIIADNMKYIKKYMGLSKDEINSLKTDRTDCNGYTSNNPSDLLKCSGLVLSNFCNAEIEEIAEMRAAAPQKHSGLSFILEDDFSSISEEFAMVAVKRQDYYEEICHYYKAAVVGVWVSEEVNKNIVSCGINKKLDEIFSYSNVCELEGYILPFDKVRDVLLSNDTVLILEKDHDCMYLFRDIVTNNSWFTSYSENELNGNELINKNDSKGTDSCFADYCPECGAKIIDTNDMFCRNCGIEL